MESVLFLITKLISAAVVLQALELLARRELLSERGIWRWSVIRGDLSGWPTALRSMADGLFAESRFVGVLCVQLTFAVALLLMPRWTESMAWLSVALFVLTLLTSMRFRGAFNGGADSMTLTVLLAVSLALMVAESETKVSICLWYLAIQVCLSFVLSGIAKLKNGAWRTGEALSQFLALPIYGAPAWTKRLAQHRGLCWVLAWMVILFECLFPLALLNHQLALVFIAGAMAFHLANYYLIGLNRFLWVWGAAYPAVYYCSL